MPWKKGQSGNPGGVSRQMARARVKLDVSSVPLMNKAIKLALATNTKRETEHSFPMLQLLVGRIVPQQVEQKVDIDGSMDINARVVPDPRAFLAQLRAEWEERRSGGAIEGSGEDRLVLPAPVYPEPEGRGAPVAVREDQGSGGES